jgi:hypothetical protein
MGRSYSKSLGRIPLGIAEGTRKSIRQFADNRRIANKAVQKAIEENKKAGIPDDLLYAR